MRKKPAAASTNNGSSTTAGSLAPSHSARALPRPPPSVAWPSPPILKSPAWMATATAKACEDEARRVVERVAGPRGAAERAVEQHAGLHGAVPDHLTTRPATSSAQQVPQRQQAEFDPARQRRPARSLLCGHQRPRRRSSRSSMASSPVMRPAFITSTRSARARISSSRSTPAAPRSRRHRRRAAGRG